LTPTGRHARDGGEGALPGSGGLDAQAAPAERAKDTGAEARVGEQAARPAHSDGRLQTELAHARDEEPGEGILAARHDTSCRSRSGAREAEHAGGERGDPRHGIG
jgi:hypothetical protein